MRRASPTRRGALALRSAAGGGFTLMEMIVAVAAVAVVSVGMAAIFDAVGKTVAGGKRVSLLNTYSGLIESRMRRDFDEMTREGFLTIRQQWVHDPAGIRRLVRTHDGQMGGRERRIDEIVFFTRGVFESARVPIGADPQTRAPLVVKADAARVYYGHGQRAYAEDLAGTPNPAYEDPSPVDLNPPNDTNAPVTALGLPGTNGSPEMNPNFYAGNWVLVRQQTLLVRPRTTVSLPGDFSGVGIPQNSPTLLDHDFQVSGQPACATIFRSLNRWYPGPSLPVPASVHPAPVPARAATTPRFASGVVDIATTDLEEVRAWVTGSRMQPGLITDSSVALAFPTRTVANLSGGAAGADRSAFNQIDFQHAWMDDAWPTQSALLLATNAPATNPAPSAVPSASNGLDPSAARVRCEPQSPALLEVLADGARTRASRASARADHLMLCANNFLPRCSEFIVEWSFGDVDANGETVWFGLPRNPAGLSADALPYPRTRFPRVGQTDAAYSRPVPRADGASQNFTASDRLIYGFPVPDDASVATAYFGYTDPTVPPPTDSDGDGQLDGTSPVLPTAWPWPKLIRVTVVLSDPQDPAVESTFQYVFSTPPEPGQE
jgi:prepilin-type N-terminal cleavage/methylation domain-containing protein